MTFEELHLIQPLLDALKKEGYTKPTPIQERAIPVVLTGRDLLACAQTGTGKTAAFALPILQRLYNEPMHFDGKKKIRVLVLTPTRELAIQIAESFAAYGKFTNLKHTVIYGGVSQLPQTITLRKGVDILVATPGRLLDLMEQGFVSLKQLQIFVLDEADRMLDMGFVHDMKRIVAKLPPQRQSLFFSATMPPAIIKLSEAIVNNPEQVEVTPEATTAETVQQYIYFTSKTDKKKLLIHLLKDSAITSVLVFTRTKHIANRLAKDLEKSGITTEAIHGNKSQTARQDALSNFKSGRTRVLVATDIAARGIDIDDLSHVINYELPNVPETYVHRIGRTGRAGADGIAFSFCEPEEVPYLKDIQKLIKTSIPVIEDHPYLMEGGTPVLVAAPPAPQKRSGRSRPARRGTHHYGNKGGGGNNKRGNDKPNKS